MMEVMGLHIPGAAFINPGTKLRTELTRAAVHRLAEIGWEGDDYRPLGLCVDEKAIVNACVGLLATGGSTNHALHIPAIARAAGQQGLRAHCLGHPLRPGLAGLAPPGGPEDHPEGHQEWIRRGCRLGAALPDLPRAEPDLRHPDL
jgi:dihydroxyacid dehydratase/phosphogluconate dehydratase